MLKDERLHRLSKKYNVARFASFGPEGRRFCDFGNLPWPSSFEGGKRKKDFLRPDLYDAAKKLIEIAGSLNIRSFREEQADGNPLVMGVTDAIDAVTKAQELIGQGYYVILNENIRRDGLMVSGVIQKKYVEFAPDDIPRCVEKKACSSLPVAFASRMLSVFLGVPVILPVAKGRLEFSAYPDRLGTKDGHVLFWEEGDGAKTQMRIRQPDAFSMHIGDKTWGLLFADSLRHEDIRVPRCSVFLRGVEFPVMQFGTGAGSMKAWTRTAPKTPVPGKYSTIRGFVDPHALMEKDDPEGNDVVSAIVQEEVPAEWSGTAFLDNGRLVIEGVRGFGDGYMSAEASPEMVPLEPRMAVKRMIKAISDWARRPVHVEWAFDGKRAWLLQLHFLERPARILDDGWIVHGDPAEWRRWDPADGLESLRALAGADGDYGILVAGEIGLGSHAADILRACGKASRFGDSLLQS